MGSSGTMDYVIAGIVKNYSSPNVAKKGSVSKNFIMPILK